MKTLVRRAEMPMPDPSPGGPYPGPQTPPAPGEPGMPEGPVIDPPPNIPTATAQRWAQSA